MKLTILFVIFFAVFMYTVSLAPPTDPLPQCSAAVHDAYKALGPDGVYYPTWHPQIDMEHGCYFDHEHGSNPAMFMPGYKPLFGYSAAHHGMSEPHAGFKVVVFDDRNTHRWLALEHQGTGNAAAAACVRFHTLDFAAIDVSTHTILADVHFMGDFGRSRAATNDREDLFPAACPTQAADAIAAGSKGERQIPVIDHFNNSYEPWRVDMKAAHNVLGFNGADFVMNTLNPKTACDTLTCTVAIDRGVGMRGNYRTVSWRDGLLGFPAASSNRGTLYTDALGSAYLQSTDPAAVKQYLAPSVAVQTRVDIIDAQPQGDAEMPYIAGEFLKRAREEPFKNNPFLTGSN